MQAANSYFYNFAVGNTSELTNVTGAVVNSYEYDPFGLSLTKSEVITNAFQYIGQYGAQDART